jgi:PIN domain nuclease of toxin-antitoxin system
LKLLLDTHIWLWSLLEPEKLSPPVSKELADAGNELWLSPISLWEVLILCERGRLELEPDPDRWIEDALEKAPLIEAPLTHRIARRISRVDLPHRDPADRFLAATAVALDLTLVTADKRLIECQGIRVLAT